MIKPLNCRRELARRVPALMAGLTSSLVASMLAGAAYAAPSMTAPTISGDHAVTRTLAARPTAGWSSVILKVNGTLTPAQEMKLRAVGGDITRRLPIISSVAVRVPSRSLAAVAALPFVTHLSLDGAVQKSDVFTVSSSGDAQAFQQYGLTGQGVTVAVVDSGVTPLPDLSSQANDFYGKAPSRLLTGVNLAAALNAPIPADKKGPIQAGVAISSASTGGGVSYVNNGSLFDPCGHGTHIAGIIAGNGSRSTGIFAFHSFAGIAPQANLVNVRVLDANGSASVSTVIAGLQWVLAHKNDNKTAPIRVINLSLGHPVGESFTTDPLCQAVEAVWKAGIVVVCAAGNQGRASAANTAGAANEGWGTAYGSIQSPGNDPCVITVGATKNTDGVRTHDHIATYSSRGPSRLDLVLKPDIIAPGNKVVSLDAGGSALDSYAGGTNQIPYSAYVTAQGMAIMGINGHSGDYFCLSGTSMAAPVVAGAAALLLQASPNLTPDTVKARLMLSADKWADPNGMGDALTYGAGYLDIPAALASTATATLPALSPTLAANSDGSLSLVMDRAAWGSTATSGSRAAWGSGLWGTGVTDLRAAWGSSINTASAASGSGTTTAADRAAWGSNSVGSSRAAWGSSVWGDRAAWGSSTSAVDLTSTAISGE